MRQFSVATLYLVSAFTFSGVVDPVDSSPVHTQSINYQMVIFEVHATRNAIVWDNAALSCELRTCMIEKTIIIIIIRLNLPGEVKDNCVNQPKEETLCK